ncbi:MAG: 1-acyl-sn-glycerol-3-phosphate acyltransferase [Sandaracinaceae bacterium]
MSAPAPEPARADPEPPRAPGEASPRAGGDVEAPGLSTLEQPDTPSFEPNRLLRWLYTRFFRHMRVDDAWSARVREAAARGIVVYVMRSISVLDFLCLDYLIKRFRLPLVRFVNDLGLWILEPFGRGGRRLRFRRQIPQEEAFAKVVQDQESGLLFLRRPPSFGEPPTGQGLDVDLIRTVVEQQRKVDRPILLMPQVFVWTVRPPNRRASLLDLLFGPSEWPGRLRVLLRFLFNFRNAQLRSGEPFDVQAFLAEHQHLTDGEAADRIRYAILRRIEREREIVQGPAKKTPSRIREELLRSPRVRKHLEMASREQEKPIAEIVRHADSELRRLAAMMDPNMIGLFEAVLGYVFSRIYDGLEVDQEGLERVREAARRGPLVFLPSHKSHVDYLVLSFVLARAGVSTPLIAAGDNLSFFPLGWFLRRAGAFFIRRSFSGRKLYSALVAAYLRKVLAEGFNVEFFMEGGRSRTGKLLPPKLGLVSMVVDAGLSLKQTSLTFVPVSIGYERIVEQRAYSEEQAGAEKQPETVGGLLKTPRVLRSRYGRLYVQFGSLSVLEDLVTEAASVRKNRRDGEDPRELRPPERRALINRVAHRMTYEIDRATMVTPAALVATALLSDARRGWTHEELLGRCAQVLAALQRLGARIAHQLVRSETQIVAPPSRAAREDVTSLLLDSQTVDEALALFVDAKLIESVTADGERVHTVLNERRLALEYHKNTVLHFFVPSALIANALEAERGPIEEKALCERVERLSRLFKYEFMYRADATFDQIFDDALATMMDAREIERGDDGTLRPVEGSLLPVYAHMVRSYFEAYRLAVRQCEPLARGGSIKKKDWLKQALSRGHRRFLAGEISLAESVAKPKLENALLALHDHGIVRANADTIEAGAALKDDEALGAFERRFAKYV